VSYANNDNNIQNEGARHLPQQLWTLIERQAKPDEVQVFHCQKMMDAYSRA